MAWHDSWKWYDWVISSLMPPYGAAKALAHTFSDARNTFRGMSENPVSSSPVNTELANALGQAVASDRAYNSAEAQKDRDFQKEMSSTAVQRGVADINAAGLNPWLAVQGSSALAASTPSGATASNSSNSAVSNMLSAVLGSNTKLAASAIQAVTSAFNSAMQMIAKGAAGA